MPVFIDNARNRFQRRCFCHMVAIPRNDSLLNSIARKIGLKTEWQQNEKTVHYDVCWSLRLRAMKAGAIPVTVRELVRIKKLEEGKKA